MVNGAVVMEPSLPGILLVCLQFIEVFSIPPGLNQFKIKVSSVYYTGRS